MTVISHKVLGSPFIRVLKVTFLISCLICDPGLRMSGRGCLGALLLMLVVASVCYLYDTAGAIRVSTVASKDLLIVEEDLRRLFAWRLFDILDKGMMSCFEIVFYLIVLVTIPII